MADVPRFINDASAGGDGTTNGISGGDAAYATGAAWEVAEQTDLDTAGDRHIVDVTGDMGVTAIDGWVTNRTDGDIILVRANTGQENNGVPGAGNGAEAIGTTAITLNLRQAIDLEDLYIETGSSDAARLRDEDQEFRRCFLEGGTGDAVSCRPTGTFVLFENCIINGNFTRETHASGYTVTFVNCVIVGTIGRMDNTTWIYKNCAIPGTVATLNEASTTFFNCVYSAAIGSITDSGSNSVFSHDFSTNDPFTDAANDDYSWNVASSAYQATFEDAGLGNDDDTDIPTNDIARDARPSDATDIGAFEAASAAAASSLLLANRSIANYQGTRQ